MRKLVVLSGGMDSTVALYGELKRGNDIECITFDYGSKHNPKERAMAARTCESLGVNLKVVTVPLDGLLKSHLLSSGGDIPEGHYESEQMKKTVVPFRNGIMLSLACGYAESFDFDAIVIGNHAGDHAIYPDCRGSFIEGMAKAMKKGTYRRVRLESPFCEITKADIATLGDGLGVDWESTWSCYKGGEVHCGKCGTCVERKEAFELAGLEDPTIYEDN